jgi:SAM-dependent methyltransferase
VIGEPDPIQAAVRRKLLSRSTVSGRISLPAAPSLLEDYVTICVETFASVGRRCTEEELAHLRSLLAKHLAEAFAASQRSNLVVTYEATAGGALNFQISSEWWTVEAAYENWLSTRQPPLFGKEPDARVWDAAHQALDPGRLKILDIGAGTGRNALALARRGHPVDVVEMTPQFADVIRAEAARADLEVRVIQQDIGATGAGDLGSDYDLIVVSEVVSDFRTFEQLRSLLELADRHLAPGGRLVLNAFLAREGYEPDAAAHELGQQLYTSVFTWEEMSRAADGLKLHLVADDRAVDYERANLPEGAWPPTSWYFDWASGRDLFDLDRDACPIDLRWLVFQKAES